MTKTALITGITGQDGGHLAKFLYEEKGYKVYGIIRGQNNPKQRMMEQEFPYVHLISADLSDMSSLVHAMQLAKPDEVYNLGAISHVGYSFKDPQLTAEITGKGVLNLLEAIRLTDKDNKVRFYQASTSEMYGGLDYNRPGKGYDEDSLFHPRSPYGVSKLFGFWITRNYRESYGMYALSGILFNHEGERRGLEFVTRKVTNAVARIKLGKQEHLELGNMDAKRDWGYAGDYVKGMWLMLQQDTPQDYVLASGETHSVREFVEISFAKAGMEIEWRGKGSDEKGYDKKTGKLLVKINPEFYRPAEVDILLGNPAKAEKELGWKRDVSFQGLVELMYEHDLEVEADREIV